MQLFYLTPSYLLILFFSFPDDLLFEGRYSSVVTAISYPTYNGYAYMEPRPCVIKTKHIGAILDDMLHDLHDVKEKFQQRISQLVRRIVMEIYILNR